MRKLLVALFGAAMIVACAGGAGDQRPAPTVMGDETSPAPATPAAPGDY